MIPAPSPSATALIDDDVRPREIEDPTNLHFVHRIADGLLPFAVRIGLHPNMVSLAGLACGAAAAFAYSDWRDPRRATLGFLAMIAWHVLDGLDGKLARATGKTSAVGRVLDGICDHATFVMVYTVIAATAASEVGSLPAAFALAVAAGSAHAVQAAYYEGERASYIRRVNGRFVPARLAAVGGGLERLYNWVQARLTDHVRPIDIALGASRTNREALLIRYRRAAGPILRAMSLLGANGRTVAIWLACLAGAPQAFWLWELFGLSAVALWLGRRLRAAEARTLG